MFILWNTMQLQIYAMPIFNILQYSSISVNRFTKTTLLRWQELSCYLHYCSNHQRRSNFASSAVVRYFFCLIPSITLIAQTSTAAMWRHYDIQRDEAQSNCYSVLDLLRGLPCKAKWLISYCEGIFLNSIQIVDYLLSL